MQFLISVLLLAFSKKKTNLATLSPSEMQKHGQCEPDAINVVSVIGPCASKGIMHASCGESPLITLITGHIPFHCLSAMKQRKEVQIAQQTWTGLGLPLPPSLP